MGSHSRTTHHVPVLIALGVVLGVILAVVFGDTATAPRGAADTAPALSSPASPTGHPATVQEPARPAADQATAGEHQPAPQPILRPSGTPHTSPLPTPLARRPIVSSGRSAKALSSAGHRVSAKVVSHTAKARRGGTNAAHSHRHGHHKHRHGHHHRHDRHGGKRHHHCG